MPEERESFDVPVEVDEAYIGGKARNIHNSPRKGLSGCGPADKGSVVSAKDRAAPGATVYTDYARVYNSPPSNRESIKHSLSDYFRGDLQTNGIESLWSMIKRSNKDIFHKLRPKLDRYVQEFGGRHNIYDSDTIDQMKAIGVGMRGKRLRYIQIVADNGLSSDARV